MYTWKICRHVRVPRVWTIVTCLQRCRSSERMCMPSSFISGSVFLNFEEHREAGGLEHIHTATVWVGYGSEITTFTDSTICDERNIIAENGCHDALTKRVEHHLCAHHALLLSGCSGLDVGGFCGGHVGMRRDNQCAGWLLKCQRLRHRACHPAEIPVVKFRVRMHTYKIGTYHQCFMRGSCDATVTGNICHAHLNILLKSRIQRDILMRYKECFHGMILGRQHGFESATCSCQI